MDYSRMARKLRAKIAGFSGELSVLPLIVETAEDIFKPFGNRTAIGETELLNRFLL